MGRIRLIDYCAPDPRRLSSFPSFKCQSCAGSKGDVTRSTTRRTFARVSLTRLIHLTRIPIKMDLDIRLALQSHLHELADIVLCRRTLHGRNERIPLLTDFGIRRQTGDVDKLLDLRKRLLVERSDTPRQRIDERAELRIRQRAIHIAI